MEKLQLFIVGVFSSLMAYLNPMTGELQSLLMLFAANFFVGLLTGILVNNESFSFKKAWKCVVECLTFLLLVSCIYFIGERKGEPDGALWCVSAITYAVIYFYSCNILRNLKALFRKESVPHKVVSFLYYLISVEFVKKIPYLNDYLNDKGSTNQDSQVCDC